MNAVTIQERSEIVAQPQTSATPSDLVRYAMDSGADLDRLEKLMAMQVQWEEREARKAFVKAMAEFKQNPPVIYKRTSVNFDTAKGNTSYMHASHNDVTMPIIEGLAKHGISHRWKPQQTDGRVIVECILTHNMGYSESTTLESMPDMSGGKNAIQAVISAKSYLERHTLLAATGLTTKDIEDDDGRGASNATDDELLATWVARANAAINADSLAKTWSMGVAEFNTAKDKAGYKAFKAVVAAKGEALKGATT